MTNSTRSKAATRSSPAKIQQALPSGGVRRQPRRPGATDYEIHAALGMTPDTVRPRRGELVDLGMIIDSRRTRLSPQGHPMTVWIARELWTPAAAIAGPLTHCDRCGSDQLIETPIHDGRSKRCDCARCGMTMGFPIWYGQPIALEQRVGRCGPRRLVRA